MRTSRRVIHGLLAVCALLVVSSAGFAADPGLAYPAASEVSNQKASFTTSDADPGTRGYIVAVAVDGLTGCPANFNFLIGDEYVKYASGHAANLGAEAIAAIA